ncbi:MFS transporter [Staphylococcus massiliensis CCUG 55927]|uniref:MFS transporter n=1 Tax=Staphylococcus massiliensis TaxID=555791 RepID=UPI0002DA7BA2|nr:MFS transporter [Staphylococcus massiliensis]POA01714.1 MFS transporter [Staphylococcus massiliensis CCUG 55927]
MRKIIVLAIGMFALGMDAYIIAGLIPSMSQSFQVNESLIGQGVTIFTLCFACSAPLSAAIFSKLSHKTLLMIALITFIIANISTSFSNLIWVYVLSRGLAGIGAGMYVPEAIHTGSQFAQAKHKGKVVATLIGGMSVGTVLGVPFGMMIADVFNWRIAFMIITFIALVSLVCISFFPKLEGHAQTSILDHLNVLKSSSVLCVLAVTLTMGMASLGLYTYSASIPQSYSMQGHMKLLLMVWGLGGLIGSFGIGYLIDRSSRVKRLQVFVIGILFISIALLIVVPLWPYIAYVSFFLWGLAGWASQAPPQSIILKMPIKHHKTAIALNNSMNYLGSALGALLGGVMLYFIHQAAYLPIYALCILLFTITMQIYLSRKA